MTDDREFPKHESQTSPRIVVVGLGGAGGNAVNNMIQSKLGAGSSTLLPWRLAARQLLHRRADGERPARRCWRQGFRRRSAVKATWWRTPRRFAKALGLGAALLIATAIGPADAQDLPDLSGSWQKVRQGCKPGQPICRIKAMFKVQNLGSTVALASTLGIYLSDDAAFNAATDTLLQQIVVDLVEPGGTNFVKMTLALAPRTSASNSFLIAVVDEGNNVTETNETNNMAVFANPGPTGIVLFDRLFGPDTVTINAGTRVRWMHRDPGRDHTVTSGSCVTGTCIDSDLFTSGHEPDVVMVENDEFVLVFNEAGVFPFFCEVHLEKMTGTICVLPCP